MPDRPSGAARTAWEASARAERAEARLEAVEKDLERARRRLAEVLHANAGVIAAVLWAEGWSNRRIAEYMEVPLEVARKLTSTGTTLEQAGNVVRGLGLERVRKHRARGVGGARGIAQGGEG